jgi:tRNA(Glu) U13 pseudouridine synthase TruD
LTAELAQTRLRHAELETIAKAERDALAAENHNLSSHYEAFQRELRAERAKVQALTDVVDRVRAIQKAGYDMPHREVMAWIEDALAPMSRLAAIGDGDNT